MIRFATFSFSGSGLYEEIPLPRRVREHVMWRDAAGVAHAGGTCPRAAWRTVYGLRRLAR